MNGAYTARMFRPFLVLCCLFTIQTPQPAVTYETFAIRFGILPAFPGAGLVAGADRTRKLDIPVTVWLLKGSNGRQVLVHFGFYRHKFLEQWNTPDFGSA